MTVRILASMTVATAADIVTARQNARRVSEQLGFDTRMQTRIATAVSEIARNAFGHAGGGVIEFGVEPPAGRPERFQVTVTDQGPGIAELDAILSGQKPFAPGHGTGLVSARRLVERFDVSSSPQGTTVSLSQRIPRGAATQLSPQSLDAIARSLPRRRADPIAVLQEQNREIIESLNDLQERQAETVRLNRELEETNRGVVALYSELDDKAGQLRSASDMKSRFLSHMSHEFRTPLNSIIALARLLVDEVDGALNAEQQRQVEYIRKSAQGLLEMVNDLLDLAKVEAGKLDVKAAPYTVESLFASLRGVLRPLLTNPSVELLIDDPLGLPAMFGDAPKVAQVMRNLISNALKFTERGHVRVSARHDAQHQRIVFEVADTGIGIAPQAIDGIFEEFSQIDGALQRGGTGLGLPLSRRLAQLMGGDVAARSELGVGSTFTLFVPVRFGAAAQAARSAPGSARLLVVDDEEPFRYVIRHIAQDAGFEVDEAADGEAGLRLALQGRPSVVVLDLHMPRVDGFAMLDALWASELRGTPVIVCTAQTLTMDQKRSLAAAYAIVPKHDVSRDSLTALIDAAITPR
jgi:signal transduction histidine kinase